MPLSAASALALLLGWLLLLPALVGRFGRGRSALIAAGTVLAVLVLVPAPSALPTSAMVQLREGREREILEALWTADPWLGRWLPRTLVPFRAAVWLHRLQAVVGAGLFAALAWVGAGRLGAVVLTAAFVSTAWYEHAAASNGPELPLTLAALLVATAWTLREHERRYVRALAVGVTVAGAVACATLRPETLLVTLPAVLWTAWPSLPFQGPRPGWTARVAGPLLVLLGSSAALGALGAWIAATKGHRGASERGAFPWTWEHLATLRLPVDLLELASPGFALLALAGLLLVATRSLPAVAWVTGVLALARLYALEGHLGAAPYETLRHGALMQGWLGLAALAAGVAVAALPRGRVVVWGAVAALAVAPRVLAPDGIPRWPGTRIETTQQVGTRFVLEVAEAFPRCVLASRVAKDVVKKQGPQDGWSYSWTTLYHGLGLAPSPILDDPAMVAKALDKRHRAEPPTLALPASWPDALRVAPCVVAVRGPDCSLNGADCEAWVDGLPAEIDVEVSAPEHNTHHGGHRLPLHLAAHPVRRAEAAAAR